MAWDSATLAGMTRSRRSSSPMRGGVGMELDTELKAAASALRNADALLIGAGAGMGVDSGLPDFRGPEGFWKAYPPFRGKQFSDLSTPHWFKTDPSVAW